MAEAERSLALFLDFENLALGFQGRRERFEIERVLKRVVEKGKIVAKKAYADWGRYSSYTEALHEAAIELIEIPRRGQTGKNSADIRLCVDAMDLAYSKEHIDTFIILSGDSDFSPLVSKLKELGKHVIGLGMQNSTSDLLRDNCDEFIYYEDLEDISAEAPALDPKIPETKRKAFALLLDSLLALRRENKEVLWSSMIKDTMKRKKPSFNETYHGYKTFSSLLEDAQTHGLVEVEVDKRSGTYVVTKVGDELHSTTPEREVREPRRGRERGRGDGRRRTGQRSRRAPRPERPERPAEAGAPADLKPLPAEASTADRRPPPTPEPEPAPTRAAEPKPVAPPPRPSTPPPRHEPAPAPPTSFGAGIFDE